MKLIATGIIAIIGLLLIANLVNSLINWWNSSVDLPGLGNITNGSLIIFFVLLIILIGIYSFLDKYK